MSIGALVKNKNSSCEDATGEEEADEGSQDRCFLFLVCAFCTHTRTCIHTITCMHTYMHSGVVSSSKAFGTYHSSQHGRTYRRRRSCLLANDMLTTKSPGGNK